MTGLSTGMVTSTVTGAGRRTGFVWDDTYFEHRTDERLGPLVPLRPEPLTRDDCLRFRTARYLDSLAEMSAAGGGNAGEGTWFGPRSSELTAEQAAAVDAAVRSRGAG